MKKRKKLFIGISAPNSVDLLIGQLRFLKEHNFDVYLLAPPDPRVTTYCLQEGVPQIVIKIERNISPVKDVLTLINLIAIFLKHKPQIVNLGTPKMSLLGMLAAYITRVPLRIYTCRGFRFEHESGNLYKLLVQLERITAFCAHRIFCISKSVRDLGVQMNILTLDKTRLIAKGSSNGVDLDQFNPDNINFEDLHYLQKEYKLENKFVFGFVGRLVDRKGIKELYNAFNEVYKIQPHARLLVVGRPFWDQIKDASVIEKLNQHPGVIMAGFQPIERVPYFLSAMDVFVLPAHWEGFGNVLIQAAAMGLPIVATKVTGCKDAVNEGFNGILVPDRKHNDLVEAMKSIMSDDEQRNIFGQNSITWSKNFEPHIIWEGYVRLYEEPI